MKFIVTITGPLMMYRLDLMKKSSPNIIKDYVIIFTDNYSYNLYKEKGYHHDFNFVIMDDIRKDYPISLEYERLLECSTEEEYLIKINSFYNKTNKQFYPYDIHRFILPYLAEHNILNFAIIDSDMMLNKDENIIKKYFESIPDSTMYMPWYDGDTNKVERINFFNEIKSFFPQISFDLDLIKTADGFIRGFNFKNKEDLMLFFNIWNKIIEFLFTSKQYYIGGYVILDIAWVCPYVMQFFQNIGYTMESSYSLNEINNIKCHRHCTRPEDTFYLGPRWPEENFNYFTTSSISDFIKHNKNQLISYYSKHLPVLEITDTHVYTTI